MKHSIDSAPSPRWFFYQLIEGHWIRMKHPDSGTDWGYVTFPAAEYAFACLGLNSSTHCINS